MADDHVPAIVSEHRDAHLARERALRFPVDILRAEADIGPAQGIADPCKVWERHTNGNVARGGYCRGRNRTGKFHRLGFGGVHLPIACYERLPHRRPLAALRFELVATGAFVTGPKRSTILCGFRTLSTTRVAFTGSSLGISQTRIGRRKVSSTAGPHAATNATSPAKNVRTPIPRHHFHSTGCAPATSFVSRMVSTNPPKRMRMRSGEMATNDVGKRIAMPNSQMKMTANRMA